MAHQRTPSLSPNRKRQHYARALVQEYLSKEHRHSEWKLKVRVGPHRSSFQVETEAERRFLENRRPYVDALLLNHDELIVIRAVLNPIIEDVRRTARLAELAKQTPELKPWLDRPVRARLLYVYPCLGLPKDARAKKVQLARFQPSYLRCKTVRPPHRKNRASGKRKQSPAPSERARGQA